MCTLFKHSVEDGNRLSINFIKGVHILSLNQARRRSHTPTRPLLPPVHMHTPTTPPPPPKKIFFLALNWQEVLLNEFCLSATTQLTAVGELCIDV